MNIFLVALVQVTPSRTYCLHVCNATCQFSVSEVRGIVEACTDSNAGSHPATGPAPCFVSVATQPLSPRDGGFMLKYFMVGRPVSGLSVEL